MPVYTSRVQFRGTEKQSEHPITDKALELAESKEIKNIINVTTDKTATWDKIVEKIDEMNVHRVTANDKKSLQLCLEAKQKGEWKVVDELGTHDVLADFIKYKLRDG
jgi:hypothetical protein